jgi:predicted methyltransferase
MLQFAVAVCSLESASVLYWGFCFDNYTLEMYDECARTLLYGGGITHELLVYRSHVAVGPKINERIERSGFETKKRDPPS